MLGEFQDLSGLHGADKKAISNSDDYTMLHICSIIIYICVFIYYYIVYMYGFYIYIYIYIYIRACAFFFLVFHVSTMPLLSHDLHVLFSHGFLSGAQR